MSGALRISKDVGEFTSHKGTFVMSTDGRWCGFYEPMVKALNACFDPRRFAQRPEMGNPMVAAVRMAAAAAESKPRFNPEMMKAPPAGVVF